MLLYPLGLSSPTYAYKNVSARVAKKQGYFRLFGVFYSQVTPRLGLREFVWRTWSWHLKRRSVAFSNML